MTPGCVELDDGARSAPCTASAPATAGHGTGTFRPGANAPSVSTSAVRRDRQLQRGSGRNPCSGVGPSAPAALLPVRVATIRQGPSKLPDILNSFRPCTSVVLAPRLPRFPDIEAGGRSGSGRRNRGSRSGPKPVPARFAPAWIAARGQSFDGRTLFPDVGGLAPRHRLNPGKSASRRPYRDLVCRNDPRRTAANRSEASGFRRERNSNSPMISNAAGINPSWERCRGLALFGGAWS